MMEARRSEGMEKSKMEGGKYSKMDNSVQNSEVVTEVKHDIKDDYTGIVWEEFSVEDDIEELNNEELEEFLNDLGEKIISNEIGEAAQAELISTEEIKSEEITVGREEKEERFFIPDIKAEPLVEEAGNEVAIYFNPWDYDVISAKREVKHVLEVLLRPMAHICGYSLAGFEGGMIRLYFNPIVQSAQKRDYAIECILDVIKEMPRSYYNPNGREAKKAETA